MLLKLLSQIARFRPPTGWRVVPDGRSAVGGSAQGRDSPADHWLELLPGVHGQRLQEQRGSGSPRWGGGLFAQPDGGNANEV